MKNLYLPDEIKRTAVVIGALQGETLNYGGNSMTISIPTIMTGNHFGLYQIIMDPFAKGPKLHFHTMLYEVFIIIEGTLTLETDEGKSDAGPGTIVYIPPFAAHGYCNNTDRVVKLAMLFCPGKNREEFFRKLYDGLSNNPEDTEFFIKLYKEYDSYPLDQQDMIPMR